MALVDPSIAMSGKPIQFESPTNMLAQAYQIQNAAQANQLNQMKMAEYERARQEEEGVRNYLRNKDLKAPATQAELLQFGKTGLEYAKQIQAQQTAALQQRAAQLKFSNDMAEAAGRIYMGVKDQTSWDAAKAKLAALGGDASALPAAYDPEFIKSELGQAQSVKDQFEMIKPKIEQIKTDDKIIFRDTNPRSPTFGKEMLPTEQMGMSPYQQQQLAISRGQLGATQQRLAFDQQKFEWEKANPGFELKESEDGTIYGVNKRTLQSFPVSVGAPAAAPGAAAAPEGGAEAPAPTPLRGKGSALTEAQAKAVGFAARAKEADQILNTTTFKPLAVATKQGLESVYGIGGGLGMVANQMMSPNDQKVDQAQRNFVNAVLRQESGAAISEAEFENARRQYFPQPGDSKAVIKQKADNRQTVIKSLETVAGPGMRKMEKANKSEAPAGVIDFGSLK